jgi:Transposase DNA-binding/Transposase Tn5 dimerisation domain
MDQVGAGWSVQEFAGLDLGDARLNRRLLTMAEAFGAQPTASINQASGDWQATKAAYAFFANPTVQASDILLPHQQRTLERMTAHPLILAVQDTCFLNYTHHPATRGLGSIGGGQQGLVMHTTMAFSAQGLPLGILEQHIWARPDVPAPHRGRSRPIAEKESQKWLSALEEAISLTPSEIRLVTIADREADLYEFLDRANDLEAEYVVRATHDRRVAGAVGQLWAHIATQTLAGTVTVTLAARPKRPQRTADLEVRVGQVVLQPPVRPADDPGIWLEPLQVWAIWLHEATPPAGAEAVDWLLLTNVAVTTWADTTERISWYGVRPGIESWHKILKSGCTVEDSRLEAAEKLIPYLTLMGVIAWRLFWLTYINRQVSEAPCTLILAEQEWKALYSAIHRTAVLPAAPPTVRQAVRWIAQLGGFLGRKGDGEPGITTIWRGWARLTDLAEMYRIMHADKDTGNCWPSGSYINIISKFQ